MGRVGYFILDILQTIVVAFAIFLIVWWLLAQPHKVDGRSMEKTFCSGDMLLTDKFTYRLRDPQRYEIIIFKSPLSAGRDLIKRVIGLPGETIELRDSVVFINGKALKEGYLSPGIQTDPHPYLQEGKPRVIPNGEYVVLGDNRPHSNDSREFGPIKRDAIIGRSLIRYWPPAEIGLIDHSPAPPARSTPRSCS